MVPGSSRVIALLKSECVDTQVREEGELFTLWPSTNADNIGRRTNDALHELWAWVLGDHGAC